MPGLRSLFRYDFKPTLLFGGDQVSLSPSGDPAPMVRERPSYVIRYKETISAGEKITKRYLAGLDGSFK